MTDKHGIKAENTHSGYTMLYGEYKDEDKPYILTVSAADRMTVEIEYSETIGYEGRYTIKNTDDYARYRTISNSLKKIDRNRVILSLGQPLESSYEYILIIDSQAKDLVGNTSEDIRGDEFYFMGTDLAPVKVPDLDEEEDRLAAGAVKAALEARAGAVRNKIEKAVEAIREVRDEISNVKDMPDVEDARAWLTGDKLAFSPIYAAHHKEPTILALKSHANGASYRFAEADTVVYGRFARPGGKKEEKAASLEIMKGTGDIKITRGKYDAVITFKVKISKGKAVAEKLFKVNIPATGNVTVEAL